ncbi:MAG: NADPH-dependent glutamate synthase [Planctomycetia bacterium]|nr:NADPH-dependent glutamate synthase [Planctomycetia bacterium]
MQARPARERVKDFDEVPLGYSPDEARREAERCLQCKDPACVYGCPVGINIPLFIKLIAEGEFAKAAQKILEANSLPAICGRVCPQEDQCEVVCVLGKKREPVAVGNLERFAADYFREQGPAPQPAAEKPTGKPVAIVGSGPASLTVAGELVRLGYQTTIFEALHKPGGVLVYGIPEFRLPKVIVQAEIDALLEMGVRMETNAVIGRLHSIDELLGRYDAVFIGVGAGAPVFLGIEGEELLGVYSANEYLTRANLMRAYQRTVSDTPISHGKNVVVIGGGNVAMDSARCAMRLGAEYVTVLYRRTRKEMPARDHEIRHAEEEGITFHFLASPTRFEGNDRGTVTGIDCQQMRLGEPDSSGRRRPVPVPGDTFHQPADTVIIAIGNKPNPLLTGTTEGLETNDWGLIVVDEATGATSIPGVYGGGDIVTGSATVISAMSAGKRAADAIDKYLRQKAK